MKFPTSDEQLNGLDNLFGKELAGHTSQKAAITNQLPFVCGARKSFLFCFQGRAQRKLGLLLLGKVLEDRRHAR
jgi:hypothetical protein